MTQQLPTEHGYYLGRDGEFLRLDEDGWRVDDREEPDDEAALYAPLTRLVPLSVEDRDLIREALQVAAQGYIEAPDDPGSRMLALAARIAPDQNGHGA